MPDIPLSSYQLRQQQKKADPWRGRKAVSVGTVLEVGIGLISHEAAGLCARIMIEQSDGRTPPPPGEHIFWLPESMRKRQIAAPREGMRIAFVHHLYLGVRRMREFKIAPREKERIEQPPQIVQPRKPISDNWD